MGTAKGGLSVVDIQAFISRLSELYPQAATLYLLGGSALCMLGSPRRTLDIDYLGNDLPNYEDPLVVAIRTVADELHVEIEGVPLDQFIPLPTGVESRHKLIGHFGNVTAYVFDPYSIAISKLDRGFMTDLQDIVFLIREGFVSIDQLIQFANDTLENSQGYDIDPREFRQHLNALLQLLS